MRVSGQFYFFNEKISQAQKAHKAQKAQNVKQAIFFLLDVFYGHKNAVFFVLHTKKDKKDKKHEKHIKSIKTQIRE